MPLLQGQASEAIRLQPVQEGPPHGQLAEVKALGADTEAILRQENGEEKEARTKAAGLEEVGPDGS